MADYYNGDLQETGGGGTTDLTQVNSRITTAEADIDQLETDVAAIDTSSLDTRLTTAESDINTVEGRVNSTITVVDGHSTTISSLSSSVSTAESEINTLEAEMDTVQADLDAAELLLPSPDVQLGIWQYAGRFTKDPDEDSTTLDGTGEWFSENPTAGQITDTGHFNIYFSINDADAIDFEGVVRDDAGLVAGDFIYIRGDDKSNIFEITSLVAPQRRTSNNNALWTVGFWVYPFDLDDYDEVRFYYVKSGLRLPYMMGAQQIWTPPGGRVVTRSTGTDYTLDAGHKFSDYSELIVLYDNQGSSGVDSKNYASSTFPIAAFTESSDYRIEVHTASGYWKHLRYMTDTTFRIPYGGGNNLGILGLWGA